MDELSLTGFRRCTKCKCWKPATTDYYHHCSRVKSGLQPKCKVCAGLIAAVRYQEQKPRLDAMARAWERNNRERSREISNRSRWRRREKRIEESRKWREENREKYLKACSNWAKKYPERAKAKNQLRRARKLAAEGSHTASEIIQMYEDQQGLCAYCETVLFGDYHVDHMTPLSRGGSNNWSNLAIACPPCNMAKGTLSVLEFLTRTRPG